MKCRHGFVSNSSSSSFIITGKTLRQVSTYMLDIIIASNKDCGRVEDGASTKASKIEKAQKKLDDKNYALWSRNLRKAFNISDIKNEKIGVCLPSCNYDTYIIQKKGLVYISTCHNHSWDFSDGYVDYSGLGADDEDEDRVHKYIKNLFFYNIVNGIVHSLEQFYPENSEVKERCNNCELSPYSYYESIDGKTLCSRCFKELGDTPKKVVEKLRAKGNKDMSAFKYLEP